MSTSLFLKDRKRGNLGASIVKELLETKGAKVDVIPDGFFQGYDLTIKLKGLVFAAEVKTDYKYSKTHNVAFERQALEHSKTDHWFYVLDPEENKEVHYINRKTALEVAPRFRGGLYGENKEEIWLVPDFVFRTQLSRGTL